MRPQLLTGTPRDLSRGVAFSLANPLTNGHMQAGAQVFAPPVAAADTAPASSSNAADVQGTGSLSGLHNTPLHVGGILLLAGAVIFGLHFLGFRVAFDAGLGR